MQLIVVSSSSICSVDMSRSVDMIRSVPPVSRPRPSRRVPMSASVMEQKYRHVRATLCCVIHDPTFSIQSPPLNEDSWSDIVVNVSAQNHHADLDRHLDQQDLGIIGDVQEGASMLETSLLRVLRETFPQRTAALHKVRNDSSASVAFPFLLALTR